MCRHGGHCGMAVRRRFLRAHWCRRGLRKVRTHRRITVFACALGLAHLEAAWALLFLVLGARITASTRATFAAIAVS